MHVENPEVDRKREQDFEEEAYKLAARIRRDNFDPQSIVIEALKREQAEHLARKNAPIPRYKPPILRKGDWNVHYDDALARVGELTALGWSDSAIKHEIQARWKFPDYNYHVMIDGSSECNYPQHRKYKLP
jgi:hypothetical protein